MNMDNIAPEKIDTFIGLYNYAKENNLSNIKTYQNKRRGGDIMKTGLGVCYGINADLDFLQMQSSVDMKKHHINIRIIIGQAPTIEE